MPNFNNNIEDYKKFKNAGRIEAINTVADNAEQREIVFTVSDELGAEIQQKQIVNIEYQKKLLENLESAPSDLQIKFKGLYEEFIGDLENVPQTKPKK